MTIFAIFDTYYRGMLFFPNAKINLGLGIIEKRPDGFHNIETLFYPIPLCDALEFIVADSNAESDRLTTSGLEVDGDPLSNIIHKALSIIREERYVPYLNIHLHKNIPVGGGLGGGSSDAAFMLRYLNRYFRFGISNDQLRAMALRIGSDCPLFIENVPAIGTGRGEILTTTGFSLAGYWILLGNPGIKINTGKAYSRATPCNQSINLAEKLSADTALWQETITNDFEAILFPDHPAIESLRDTFINMGAFYSAMSGSGSTVFGLFRERPSVPPALVEKLIYCGLL